MAGQQRGRHRTGPGDGAREIFERVRGFSNHVGLRSAEHDPSTGRVLGNFPAFSHVELINSVFLYNSPRVQASGDEGRTVIA